MLRFALFVVLSFLLARASAGQEAARDSLRSYDLAEIVVGGAGAVAVQAGTVERVTLAGLARQDAVGVAEAGRLIRGAHLQTNSRGETLLYLRGTGERQLALFFDGALLNVPWDNRVDLSLVPAGVLGGMTVSKGAASVLYGTNAVGGAINLTSRALEGPGMFTEASVRGGAGGSRDAQVTVLGRGERLDVTLSGAYARRDGLPLSEGAALPFNQAEDGLRTNTDRRLTNLFARVGFRQGRAEAGLSVLHVDGEKGVAPEGHLDPAVERVRFWRYPVWRNTMLIWNTRVSLTGGWRLRGAAWGTRFEQAIVQYETAAYATPTDRQEDEDRTLGARLVLDGRAGPGAFRLALNGLGSQHDQRDLVYPAPPGVPRAGGSERPVPADPGRPVLRYEQLLGSVGAEYEVPAGERLELLLGGSVDAMTAPRTGDKPAYDPLVDYGLNAGVAWEVRRGWALSAAAGRKVRFPTMRELFGEALRRFLLNPDLGPETAYLAEAGLSVGGAGYAGEAVFFLNRTFDTIDQRRVDVGGVSMRQRVNLEGSVVYGLEVGGILQPAAGLSVEGHATWLRARGIEGGEHRPLVEKPAVLATVGVSYNTSFGVAAFVQGVYTGRAWGQAEDGSFEALPKALELNVRLAYRKTVRMRRLAFAELFVRADNLTDAVTLPQPGLPGAGRVLRGGLNVTF